MNSSTPPRLEVRSITKQFPGVIALQDVDLHVAPGEVLAVVGENGAGKSTLMKILAGVQTADAGQILIEGTQTEFHSVDDAFDVGIALIHQELNLSDNLDAAANIFLGREPNTFGWIRRSQMEREARHFLSQVGLEISPRTLVRDLAIGQQQLIEIAKALSINAKVLIMDEPTSSLSQRETETLMQVIDQLREQGVSILYISHRLAEIQRIADRVTVLRDGQNAGELQKAEITHDAMVSRMVGRDVSRFYQRTSHQPGDVVLKVQDFSTTAWPAHRNTVTVRQGEIVGLAGLVGAGRSEFLRAVFGVDRPLTGSLEIAGELIPLQDVRSGIAAGLALVPEDRKQQGLILEMSIRENASLASLSAHAKQGCFVDAAYERNVCEEFQKSLGIRMAGPTQLVGLLSGGNQQKVVLAKWLALKPKVLLLDEPTRGIDIGAKEEIYHLIDQLAKAGVAILFASSEMEEIIGISDRVLVMREGEIKGELTREQLSEQAVMALATQD
ncbi:sugar ABC transporter ATP-binding protein [Rubinisphaera sp.]|uniref:sugar ABC transporter ATP-binding protein n=1 Tax=Rubinisphaera sp. TaxID=2024857 RepID=UPI000C11A416|nr:sugar ABC transporter ATP-binding protein [Rubinisphaera sp.]MBV09641.1 D-xylose ABC transporter ATP-binding protein [Rubinisphaera sp.]HCS54975.1 D-xylose ABC transporter ATP-binding protein [Planctomycetaceae bacterium]